MQHRVSTVISVPVLSDLAPFNPKATKRGMFPHLYNSLRIGRDEFDSISEWKKESADWDHVVDKAKDEEWLVY